MANINVTLEADVDINVEDFYYEMCEDEKKEMLGFLLGSRLKVSSGDDDIMIIGNKIIA